LTIKLKNLSVLPGFSIKTGNGWKKLVTECFIELDSLNIRVRIKEVTEKFGGLSIYYDLNGVDNSKVEKIIKKYITQAYKTCVACASIENVSTKAISNNWDISTQCEKCSSKEITRNDN
jgi:hypothetical protein